MSPSPLPSLIVVLNVKLPFTVSPSPSPRVIVSYVAMSGREAGAHSVTVAVAEGNCVVAAVGAHSVTGAVAEGDCVVAAAGNGAVGGAAPKSPAPSPRVILS